VEFQFLDVAEFRHETVIKFLYCLIRVYVSVGFEQRLKWLTVDLLRNLIEIALSLAAFANLFGKILQGGEFIIEVVLVGAGFINESH
jgi:hypothetical protein